LKGNDVTEEATKKPRKQKQVAKQYAFTQSQDGTMTKAHEHGFTERADLIAALQDANFVGTVLIMADKGSVTLVAPEAPKRSVIKTE
jgi:hypothetical protein